MKVNPSTGEFTIEIEGQQSKRVYMRLFEKVMPIGYLEMSDEDPVNHYHHGVWCRANRRSNIWKRIG